MSASAPDVKKELRPWFVKMLAEQDELQERENARILERDRHLIDRRRLSAEPATEESDPKKRSSNDASDEDVAEGKKPKTDNSSLLAPAKKKWQKAADPSNRTLITTNATLKAPQSGYLSEDNPSSVPPASVRKVPEWYSALSITNKRFRGDSITLRNLRTLHDKALQSNMAASSAAVCKVRSFLHQLGLFDFGGKEKVVIKNSMLLTDGTLDSVSAEKNKYPSDVRNLAMSLQRRWWAGDTDPNLMRGIKKNASKTKKDGSHTTYCLDPKYPFRASANYVGAGSLKNGQWWPLQICAVRDGAHGEIEAGISGLKDKGAVSIVVSGGGYANIDDGATLQYCGTANTTDTPSYGTVLMKTAYENKTAIRVLRSAKCQSEFRPQRGLRYDGLYTIQSFEVIEPATALHRFTLIREDGQEPIYYQGLQARPSDVELVALERDREMRGMAA